MLNIEYQIIENNITIVLAVFIIVFGLMVIFLKYPILNLLSLICTFFCTSLLLLKLGFEFIGLLYIIVYVGALLILFLFVIMMLNLNIEEQKITVINKIKNIFFILFIFFSYFFWIFNNYLFKNKKELFTLIDLLDETKNIQINLNLYKNDLIEKKKFTLDFLLTIKENYWQQLNFKTMTSLEEYKNLENISYKLFPKLQIINDYIINLVNSQNYQIKINNKINDILLQAIINPFDNLNYLTSLTNINIDNFKIIFINNYLLLIFIGILLLITMVNSVYLVNYYSILNKNIKHQNTIKQIKTEINY
jgi:NADH-ubiquinone oxidoreductase chain 6